MLGFWLTTAMTSKVVSSVPTILAQTVSTSSHQVYQPTNRKVSKNARKSGGSRGSCPQKIQSSITLLVPEDHLPATTSAYPTFSWYQGQKSSLPIKFTLLEPGHKPLYSVELPPTQSDITTLTWPKHLPPLEVGKKYRWSVSILCSSKHPSRNPYAEAWVERISLPAAKLTRPNGSSCNLAYAQAGIWYNALSCNLSQFLQPDSSLSEGNIFSLLLKEVGLEDILKQ